MLAIGASIFLGYKLGHRSVDQLEELMPAIERTTDGSEFRVLPAGDARAEARHTAVVGDAERHLVAPRQDPRHEGLPRTPAVARLRQVRDGALPRGLHQRVRACRRCLMVGRPAPGCHKHIELIWLKK